MILLLEKKLRGGLSSYMEYRYVISDDNKKILFFDINNLYGHSMSLSLPYEKIKFDTTVKLQRILKTADDDDFGYSVQVDLKYPDENKEETKNTPSCLVNRTSPKDKLSNFMKKIKPDNFIQNKKLICDWTDKKK